MTEQPEAAGAPAPGEKPGLEITASRQFTSWMTEQRLSLAFTTYQAGKLFLLGLDRDGGLSVFERTFNRCMGLAADPGAQTLWMSALYQLWRFENPVPTGQQSNGYDRIYVPQVGYTTGDIDIHDIGLAADGRPVFVNTLFSCLATVSETHSFRTVWTPPFISRLAAEERCHLNGLAMREGRPAYVTAVSESDVADGWRDHRLAGGCVTSVEENAVVMRGLSMPHSPRLHAGRLWLLNSGTGEFGWVDAEAGRFEPVAFCPGYARGLAFAGDFAVIGLSKCRGNRTFEGLRLESRLATAGGEARCGLLIVDLRSGDAVHSLRLDGVVRELFDVAVLRNVRRPMAIGFKTDEIRRTLSVE